ncbi:MAG: ABC transporter permease, partial [Xanthobacteraceae bacterium]
IKKAATSAFRRIDLARAVMVVIAVVASASVLVLLATILWLSVTSGVPGDPDLGFTFRHYVDTFLDGFTYRVLWNTFLFWLVTLVVAFALALPMAWLIERTDFPGKAIVLTLMTVALLIPGFAVALGWVFLLHPRIGLINQALIGLFGLTTAPFNITSILGMGIVEGLSLTPLAFIMTSVVLRAMDPALEEAAAMSGAPPRQAILRVTLPVVWPGLFAATIYVSAVSFAAFDVPAILGLTNRIYTFSTYVFRQLTPTEGPPEYGSVASLSVIMVILAMVLSWGYRMAQRQAPRYAIVTGKAYRPRIIPLGRAKSAAVAFVVAFFLVSQALPILMLGWASALPFLQMPSAQALAQVSAVNYRGIPAELLLRSATNTAILMALVPTITVAVSVAISWVVLRSRARGRALIEFLSFLPVTVPPIVFSVAALLLVLFVLRGAVALYGTLSLLVIVYVIARLSYGTRMTNSAMIQIHHELDEAARVSGAGTAGVLRTVLLPLLTPTILYAWIWIALLTYRELTLPVVLATGTNLPFSVLVWSYVQSSSYGRASAAALIMLAVMVPFLLLYWIVARKAGIGLALASASPRQGLQPSR